MSTWQNTPGGGYYPGQQAPNQGYPNPNVQYPGYPPNQGYPPTQGYPAQDGYPPAYAASNPPAPGFIPGGAPPYGQVPPPSTAPFAVPPQSAMYGSGYDGETGQDEPKGFDFNDQSIRRGFIRKVYSILMCQLLLTLGMIALFVYHAPTRNWVHRNVAVFYIALVASIVLIIALSCCTNLRRKAPMNFIFLGLFTLVEGFLLATIASKFQVDEVMIAVGVTAAVCLGLTIFAFQTKWDFTMMGGILFVALIILIIFGIVAIIFPGRVMSLLYASAGALLFSVYLVYDTQMMMGGTRKYSISPEEYIFAALNLYLDIANIFLYILQIIGASRN